MLVLPYKASIIHKTAYVPVVTVLSPLCKGTYEEQTEENRALKKVLGSLNSVFENLDPAIVEKSQSIY
jgi:hypothetical protein